MVDIVAVVTCCVKVQECYCHTRRISIGLELIHYYYYYYYYSIHEVQSVTKENMNRSADPCTQQSAHR